MYESRYGLSVWQLLDEAFRSSPDKEAFIDGDVRLSFRDLRQQATEIASGLKRLGVGKGDRVAVCLPNWHEFVVAVHAVARLGAILVPLNTRYRLHELEHILQDCEPTAVFCTGEADGVDNFRQFRELQGRRECFKTIVTVRHHGEGAVHYEQLRRLGQEGEEEPANVNAKDDLFAIMYTSGTTGKPKGAMLTHRNVVDQTVTAMIGGKNTSRDAALHTTPYFHILGLSWMLGVAVTEGKAVLMDRYNAEQVLELIEREQITLRAGVPTMFILEMKLPAFQRYDLSSLRKVSMAAAFASRELINRVRQAYGCSVHLAYGLTETAGLVSLTVSGDDEVALLETVGRPAPGVEVKVVDEARRELPAGQVGELAVRSPGVMKGYYNLPELTREVLDEEGWFYTGDLVSIDERGYIRIAGRKKEMIIRGGYNIYPLEVERAVAMHPDVDEVAVIGLPDTVLGEIACAVVRPRPGASPDAEHIRAFVRGEIADYKVPDHIVFMGELPKNAMGKVQKAVLKEIVLKEKRVALR